MCYDKELISTVAYVIVALSIPLVLFSIDLRSVKTLAKSTIIGFVLCIASALPVAVFMFFISRLFMDETGILSAIR